MGGGKRKELLPSYYENTLTTLERIFEAAKKTGAIFRNPAKGIELKKEKKKKLKLPSRDEFTAFIAQIRSREHRTAQEAADLAELLAYTGCRISEARRLEWEDVDERWEELFVKGDEIAAGWVTRMAVVLQ